MAAALGVSSPAASICRCATALSTEQRRAAEKSAPPPERGARTEAPLTAEYAAEDAAAESAAESGARDEPVRRAAAEASSAVVGVLLLVAFGVLEVRRIAPSL